MLMQYSGPVSEEQYADVLRLCKQALESMSPDEWFLVGKTQKNLDTWLISVARAVCPLLGPDKVSRLVGDLRGILEAATAIRHRFLAEHGVQESNDS